MLRRLRRLIEYTSLLVIILIPFLSYLNYLRQAYGKGGFHIANLSGGWLVGRLFTIYELTLGRLEDPVSLIDSFKGTFWSITILGLNISDPLAGIGHLLSTRDIYLPLLISLLIPVLFTLIFGRAYCGWICPVNTITEFTSWIRDRAVSLLPWMKDIKIGHGIKYWVLIITLLIIAFTGIPLFAYYLPYLILGREIYNLFFFHAVSAGASLFMLLILFELFLSQRGWCRYLCPSGALLSLIGRFSIVRLKKRGSPCPETCFECDRVCPMSLKVRGGMPGGECTNCGECILICPQKSLGFTFNIRRGVAYAIILLTVILGILYSVPAKAHHIAGLPHYGYTENYPQVPTNEQSQEVGRFVVSLTTIFFQGIEQKLSEIPYDTQFYVHIYDKDFERKAQTSEAAGFQNPFDPENKRKASDHEGIDPSYRGKLYLKIFNKDDMEVATYRLDTPSEEAIYRFRHYFKRPGKYNIMIQFFPEGKKESVSYPVSIEVGGGKPWVIPLLVIIVMAGTGFFIYYRKKKLHSSVPAG